MTSPKRHHYLPQFYLERFCRDGGFSVFDRERNEFRKQTPINTALKSHYYSVEDKTGKKDTRIESFLSELEGHAKQIVQKLEHRENIVDDEKKELALFIAFMMNRVPDFEKAINKIESTLIQRMADTLFSDEERLKSILQERSEDTEGASDISAKELVEFHKSGNFEIVIHRNESLRMMVDVSLNTANYFRQMDWGIFHCQDRTSFITTDNPVVLVPPSDYEQGFWGVGILTKGAQKLFPLSQTACLVMLDHGNAISHSNVDQLTTRQINLILAAYSDRFVIGRDETLVKNIVSTTRLTEWKSEGRIKID